MKFKGVFTWMCGMVIGNENGGYRNEVDGRMGM